MSKMVAVDTSCWIDYLKGGSGRDLDLLDVFLEQRQIYMIPVVLAELFSSPFIMPNVENMLATLPSPGLVDGFWNRAGILRRAIHIKKRKANLADTLIAQYCMDHELPLLTRDEDFKSFVNFGLTLI